jgi:trans-aconitate methyltransferase
MAQYHWDPNRYLALMLEEVPDYERLQDETAAAAGSGASRLLELGMGTGETARRVLARNPAAVLIGLDASHEMLDQAGPLLPVERVELRTWHLADPLRRVRSKSSSRPSRSTTSMLPARLTSQARGRRALPGRTVRARGCRSARGPR